MISANVIRATWASGTISILVRVPYFENTFSKSYRSNKNERWLDFGSSGMIFRDMVVFFTGSF